MFILLVFGVFCVWKIYTSLKDEGRPPLPPSPPPIIKSPHRLQREAVIRKIAGCSVSEEKMDALCLEAPHILVSSHAGSGKTQAIALKVALAIHTGTNPQNTLSLCFNKSAAAELRSRIEKYSAPAPATTFHGLAYAIVRPRHGSLLHGEQQHALMRLLLARDTGKREKTAEKERDEQVTDLLAYISSAKHRGLSTEDVHARCSGIEGLPFDVASIYRAYTDHLTINNLIDFDDLVHVATDTLRSLPRLPVVRLAGRSCDLSTLRLLALDEFQDCSRSFYNLVKTLTEKNPSIRTFAVGDAWQAINSYAGSDLGFFTHFETYFPGAKRAQLQTNYRSRKAIVEHSNAWMKGQGAGGVALQEGGSVEYVRIPGEIGGISAHQILKELLTREQERSVLVLARRNACHGKDLTALQEDLSMLHPNVRVSTIHASKGGEADVVFFLKEPARTDRLSCLSAVLGQTREDVQAEERRIEYVAITRPRSRLVVIE